MCLELDFKLGKRCVTSHGQRKTDESESEEQREWKTRVLATCLHVISSLV